MDKKKANFRRLAEKRVQRAIHDLRLIGNLSNRGNYSYDEAEITQMFGALDAELKKSRLRFQMQEGGEEAVFKFK